MILIEELQCIVDVLLYLWFGMLVVLVIVILVVMVVYCFGVCIVKCIVQLYLLMSVILCYIDKLLFVVLVLLVFEFVWVQVDDGMLFVCGMCIVVVVGLIVLFMWLLVWFVVGVGDVIIQVYLIDMVDNFYV